MSGISLFILPDIWVTYKYSINCICLWAVYLSHYSKMIYNGHLLHKLLTDKYKQAGAELCQASILPKNKGRLPFNLKLRSSSICYKIKVVFHFQIN